MIRTHDSVLLIGASRGLGCAIAEQYVERGAAVLATTRGSTRTGLHELADRSSGRLEIEHVDITVPEDLHALASRLSGRRFDLLFINAGISNGPQQTAADVSTEVFCDLMVTNALGPLRAIEALGGLVAEDGTIAVMSSGQGSIANNERGGFDIYRASKAALNQLMRSYAARHRGDRRTLLLMAPGWVRTDLGGATAPLSIEESIPPLVSTVEAQRGHGSLRFLDRHGEPVAW